MKNECTLSAVGDVFLGDSTVYLGHGVLSSIKKNGEKLFIENISPLLDDSDINFFNMETVLSGRGRIPCYLPSIEMRGAPAFAKMLGDCGWTVANVANNHMFQHGKKAYLHTLELLENHGLQIVGNEGTHGTKPLYLEVNGVKLCFIGYSTHYEQYWPDETPPYSLRENPEEIIEEIKKISSEFDGHIVCSIHWGKEFLHEISAQQQAFAHKLIDAGVKLVLGHHSHVLQGIEEFNGGLIAYGLGNFIFDFPAKRLKQTALLKVKLDKNGIVESNLTPVLIGDDFCPRPASGEDGDAIRAILEKWSEHITSGALRDDETLDKVASQVYAGLRNASYKYFFSNFYKYNPILFFSVIFRAIMRRLGIAHDP